MEKLPKEIKRKLDLFEAFENNSPDVIWIMDLQLQTVYMSPSVKQNLGYTAEEYISMPHSERLPEESYELMKKIMFEEIMPLVKGEKPDLKKPVVFEMLHEHKNGNKYWGEVSMNLLYDEKGKIAAIMGITRNINDRKKIQKELEKSREQYYHLVENSPDWIWEVDAGYRLTYVNEVSVNALGIPAEHIIGRKIFEFSDPATVEKEITLFSNMLKLELPFTGLHQVLLDKNGRVIHLEVNGNPIFDNDGGFCGYRAVGRDITDKQLTQRKVERFERDRNVLLQLDNFALIILDENFEIIEWSAGATRIFGYSRKEAMAEKIFPLLWDVKRRRAIAASIKRKVKSAEIRFIDAENFRKDKRSVQCKWSVHSRFDENDKYSGAFAYVTVAARRSGANTKAEGLNAVIENAGIMVFMTNLKLKITYLSKPLNDMLGWDMETIQGNDLSLLLNPTSLTNVKRDGVTYAKVNQKWFDVVELKGKDGVCIKGKLEINGQFNAEKLSGYIFYFSLQK